MIRIIASTCTLSSLLVCVYATLATRNSNLPSLWNPCQSKKKEKHTYKFLHVRIGIGNSVVVFYVTHTCITGTARHGTACLLLWSDEWMHDGYVWRLWVCILTTVVDDQYLFIVYSNCLLSTSIWNSDVSDSFIVMNGLKIHSINSINFYIQNINPMTMYIRIYQNLNFERVSLVSS